VKDDEGEKKVRKPLGAVIASLMLLVTVFAFTVTAGNGLNSSLEEDDRDLDEWTIMVYVAADNNLEEYGLADLVEMESIGSYEGVNILVLMDTIDVIDGSHWYVIDPVVDDEPFTHVDLETSTHICDCEEVLGVGGCPGELNMGDGETLKEFIVAGVNYAPAKKYMLVVWNHGGGWYGACWDDSHLTEDERIDRLTTEEIGNAIRDAETETGAWMDIIGFDACLMSGIEVSYEICGLGDYMIASVTGIPINGWPYHLFLDDLIAMSSMDPETLGMHILAAYTEYYGASIGYGLAGGTGIGGWTGTTLSLIDLSAVNALALALDELALDLMDLLASAEISRGTIAAAASARTPCLEMSGQQFPYVDIGYFAEVLADSVKELKDSAGAVNEALEDAMVACFSVGQVYGGAFKTTGMTVYLPISPTYTWVDYTYETEEEALAEGETIYWGLDYVIDTNWDEWIMAFCLTL